MSNCRGGGRIKCTRGKLSRCREWGRGEGGLGHSLEIIKWTWDRLPHPPPSPLHPVTFRHRRAHLRIYVGKNNLNLNNPQEDNVCLSSCWSWFGSWKRGTNRISEHWLLGLRHLLHTSKCTFMPWLLDSLDLPGRRKDTHQLMSRVDYGFNQWSVVSFVIKKLYMYLFMVKQCIYLVILMYFMQIYFHLLWSGNRFTDFVVFLNFLSALHATWIIKKSNILRRFKESR